MDGAVLFGGVEQVLEGFGEIGGADGDGRVEFVDDVSADVDVVFSERADEGVGEEFFGLGEDVRAKGNGIQEQNGGVCGERVADKDARGKVLPVVEARKVYKRQQGMGVDECEGGDVAAGEGLCGEGRGCFVEEG